MAKFIYKMQNILDIKLKLEDQAKTAYGNAVARLEEEEKILQKIEDRKMGYENQLSELMSSSLEVREILRIENAVEIMNYKAEEQKLEVMRAERAVEKAREKLQEAMVEKKIQEKLREKAFEEFKQEINAQEQKEIDELVSYKYTNRASSEEV